MIRNGIHLAYIQHSFIDSNLSSGKYIVEIHKERKDGYNSLKTYNTFGLNSTALNTNFMIGDIYPIYNNKWIAADEIQGFNLTKYIQSNFKIGICKEDCIKIEVFSL